MPTPEPSQPSNQRGPAEPLVLVVTINYNEPDQTVAMVESLLAMDYGNFRVLVIDNGSTNGSAAALEHLNGGLVEFVASKVNRGFAGACNFGFERARAIGADFIWLVNNDSVVPSATLTSLIALAETDPRIGLLTPVISSLGDVPHITFAGGVLDVKSGLYDETNDLDISRSWTMERPNAGLVIGTAMLVRTQLIRDIGMLDERFFMYYEDIDYCVRSQAAGYRNVVDAGSAVYHLEKNMGKNPADVKPHYWYYNARNSTRFWRKHLGRAGALKQAWWMLNKFLKHRNQVKANPAASQAILAGIWHGWLNKSGPYNPAFRMPSLPAALVTLYGRRQSLQPK